MMRFENEGRLLIQSAFRDFSQFSGEILSCDGGVLGTGIRRYPSFFVAVRVEDFYPTEIASLDDGIGL